MLSLRSVQVAALAVTLLLLQLVANGTSGQLTHLTVVPPENDSSCLRCIDANFNVSSDVTCCLVMDDLSDHLPKSGTLKITLEWSPHHLYLSKSLIFTNLTHVEISGPVPKIANVSCMNQGIGVMFNNIPSVKILNVRFDKCGAEYPSSVTNKKRNVTLFSTSLFFERCGNVVLNRTFVLHSHGYGVTMYDVTGDCVIYKSHFKNNTAVDNSTVVGGGGLYIDFTSRKGHIASGSHSKVSIHISKCTFESNYAGALNIPLRESTDYTTFSQGGGLFIRFQDLTAMKSLINISNCSFKYNEAEFGGGMHILILNSTQENTVHVSDTVLKNNRAFTAGGGMVLYIKRKKHQEITTKTRITFKNCNFRQNRAGNYGGGTVLRYDLGGRISNNQSFILFDSCVWNNSIATLLGSAVDVSAKFPTTKEFGRGFTRFKDCIFRKNWILSKKEGDIIREGRAAFMVSGSSVSFESSVVFHGNNGSALYALSSKIQFSVGSYGNFTSNIGRNGGAIQLISSHLYIETHVRLDFVQNKAYLKGGAIHSFSLDEFGTHRIYPYDCFLQRNNRSKYGNITLNFWENKAAYTVGKSNGNSIYTTSLLSCTDNITRSKQYSLYKILRKIANFKFHENNTNYQVATSEATLSLMEEPIIHAIPGMEMELNISTKDEFNHTVPSNYRVFVRGQKECHNHVLEVDDRYKSLPINKVRFQGSPGASCKVYIEMEGNRQVYTIQQVTLVECPPGFILKKDTSKFKRLQCVCPSNSNEEYLGFIGCDKNVFKRRISRGVWTGYEVNATERDLRVAYCPHSFCSHNNSSDSYSYLLPGVANKTILDNFVCEKGRTGKLCGSCRSGYSVHFHSPEYSCKKSDLCYLGWLFYIVSELVPLTLIFAIILRFNISFTSGALTGFLFYAQIVDFLGTLTTNEGRGYPSWTLGVIKVSNFVYGLFNLNFFVSNTLSFCLWEGAGTLDIITFKFVTISFAFFLILTVFLVMNICTLKYKRYSLKISLQQSIVHGVTAFLVICLTQTIKVFLVVFSSATVYERGGVISSYQAFYEGSLTYLSGKHLTYAIPSLLIAITIAFVPMLLLLWYPLGPRIIAKYGFSESKLVMLLEKLFLVNRLKPVIDSFQGCYKDNFRFFAGLLFLYRIIMLASVAFSFGYTQSYILIQAQLAVMLLAQSLAHPYKERFHNVLDSLLFFNLTIINILTIFIDKMSLNSHYQLSVHVAAGAQAIFTILPLLWLLLFVCKKLLTRIACKRICFKHAQNGEISEDEIPFRLLEESA